VALSHAPAVQRRRHITSLRPHLLRALAGGGRLGGGGPAGARRPLLLGGAERHSQLLRSQHDD
jgi:hypothetical protein